jgi:hypothetical protein
MDKKIGYGARLIGEIKHPTKKPCHKGEKNVGCLAIFDEK